MAHIDLSTDNAELLSIAEREAYANGDTDKALLIARVIELLEDNNNLKQTIDDIETLEDWEWKNGPAYEYVQFFHQCFERLNGHYHCPSITSEWDKNQIFEAIELGENREI